MIASGEKKEEYREIKPYWNKRLEESIYEPDYDCIMYFFKEFATVIFRNGYSKQSPLLQVKCAGISVSYGAKREWGGNPDIKCYIIKLGDLLPDTELSNDKTIQDGK